MRRSRTARVVVAMMNNAAMRMAQTFKVVLVIRRPKAQIADWDAAMASSSAVNKRPPATAPEDNSMATNSNAPPRNTDEQDCEGNPGDDGGPRRLIAVQGAMAADMASSATSDVDVPDTAGADRRGRDGHSSIDPRRRWNRANVA